jgi:uncharacterized membrane protein YphA (DoxX/SURF4 family)
MIGQFLLTKFTMELSENKAFPVFLFVLRVWFASVLLNHAVLQAGGDAIYFLFNFIAGHKASAAPTQSIVYLTRGLELLCCLSLLIGLFVRYASIIIITLMSILIVASMTHLTDFGVGTSARIFFWFSAILIVFGAGKWSTDQFIGSKKAA